MVTKNRNEEEMELTSEDLSKIIKQIFSYLKIEAPEQRKHQLFNKLIDAGLVTLIIIGTAWLGAQGILEGQMVAGLYGAALGYLFGAIHR